MLCPKCRSELLLDHVVQRGDTKDFYYACINPQCSERGTAFKPTGETTKSTIQTKEE